MCFSIPICMKYLIKLFVLTILFSTIQSCEKTSKSKKIEAFTKLEINTIAKDSFYLSQSRTILKDAITRIKNGQFDEPTEQLLDSAMVIFKKVEKPPIQDLSNIYSYFDMLTYEKRDLDKNINYNKEFIKRYKNYEDKNYEKLLMASSNLGYSLMDVGKPLMALEESIFPIKNTIDSLLNVKIADTLKNQLQVAQLVNYRQLILASQELENGKILRQSVNDFELYLKGELPERAKEFMPYALSNLADVCIELGELERAKRHIAHWNSLIAPDKYIDKLMMIDLKSKIQKINGDFSGLINSFKKGESLYKLISKNNSFKNIFYSSILYRVSKVELEKDILDDKSFKLRTDKLLDLSKSNIERDQIYALYAYDLEILRNFKSNNLDTLPYFLNKQLKLASKFNKSDFLNKHIIHSSRLALLQKDSVALKKVIKSFLTRIKVKNLDAINIKNKDFKDELYGSLHTAHTSIEISNLLLDSALEFNNHYLFDKSYKLALLSGMLVDNNKSQFNNNNLEKKLIDNVNSNLLKAREHLKNLKSSYDVLNENIIEIVEQNTNSQLTIKNKINNIKYNYPADFQTTLDSLNIIEARIAQVRSKILISQNENMDKLKNSLDSLGLNKTNILLTLRNSSYSNKIEDVFTFDVASLKTEQSNDEAILRFYSYDNLYAFLISKTHTSYFNLGSSKEISKSISTFLNDIRNIKDIEKSLSSVKSYLKPVIDSLTYRKITIVPEGVISLLPFELFLDNHLKDEITTDYNTSLKVIQTNSSIKNTLLASFSPTYEKENIGQNRFRKLIERGNTLYDLPYAQEEASYVASLFKGDLYNGATADKENFISSVPNYGILHLAMHAYVDEQNEYDSKLLFSGNNNENHLDLNEIYNLNLNAELTTLSACNTGFGRIDPIEGVLSLSRAFQYAGSKSTVTSLWRVPDKQTSVIMKDFYTNLKKGETKSEALKNAKLNYLLITDDPNLKHPYYWAGFILTGDTSAITTYTNWWVHGIGALLVLIVLFFAIKKRLKTN